MKKFLSTSAILAIQPFITKIIAYFVIPLYTLTLTPLEYGNVEFVLAIGVFFKTFISMSTTSSFWKYINESEQWNPKDVIFTVVLIPITLGLIVILGGVVFLIFSDPSSLKKNIFIYCLSETFTILYMVSNLVIRNEFKASRFFTITFLYVISFVLSNYYFLSYVGLKEDGVFWSYLMSSIIVGIGSVFILKGNIRFRIIPELIKDVLKYSYPLMITNLIAIGIAFSDRILIKFFRNSYELGLYSYGFKFGSIVKSILIDVFFILWNPIRWKIYKFENGQQIFALFTKGIFLFFILSGFVFSILGDLLGRMLSSDDTYNQGLKIVPVVTFGYVFYGLYYYSTMGLLFKSKTYLIVRIVLVVSILNVIFNVILLNWLGYFGSALSMFLTYTIMFYIGFYQSQRFYHVDSFKTRNIICVYIYIFWVLMCSIYKYESSFVVNILFLIFVTIINISEIKYLYKNLGIIKKSLANVY